MKYICLVGLNEGFLILYLVVERITSNLRIVNSVFATLISVCDW